MTVGSWSTLKEEFVATSASANSSLVNGTHCWWSGVDSVRPSLSGYTPRERFLQRVHQPLSDRPYGRPKAAISPQRVAALAESRSSSVFERTAAERLLVYSGDVPPARDWNVPHPYHKEWRTFKEVVFRWYMTADPVTEYTGTVASSGFSPVVEVDDPYTPDHAYKLVERLRAKVVGTDFNLASFLGAEGRDTIRLLTETAQRIALAQKYARRLKMREALLTLRRWGRPPLQPTRMSSYNARLQEDIYRDLASAAAGKNRNQSWATVPASLYLEYHLAIAPLLGDVVAAAEQLAHITQVARTQRVRASITVKGVLPLGHEGPQWAAQRTVKKSVVAYFTATPEPLSFMGFQDPEVTLWNALPMSFVSDYMYNIGGFLSARAAAGAMGTGVFVTSTKDVSEFRQLSGIVGSGHTVAFINPDDSKYLSHVRGSFNRAVGDALSVPAPSFAPLGAFKSWQRMATVVSLAALSADRGTTPFKYGAGS